MQDTFTPATFHRPLLSGSSISH